MLEPDIKLHREFFASHTPDQKLFLLLTLTPEWKTAQHRPDLSVAFVIDTSGSMREQVSDATGENKLDLVMEAMSSVLKSDMMQGEDRLALVSFDDQARVNTPFQPAARRARLLAAINSLAQQSGTTYMGDGLQKALSLLETENGSKRIILLTDGETMDEDVVDGVSHQLRDQHIPVTVVGVGDFNEEVLTSVADRTQGRLLDIVPDRENPQPPSVPASELPQAILDEVEEVSREVITDISLTVRTVRGVTVNRITRVAPQQVEVDMERQPYTLGNAASGENSAWVLECTIAERRPPSRIRLARLGIAYRVPGADFRGETQPIDIVVEFTPDQSKFQAIDADVMQWVQQRNVEGIIKRAAQEATTNPEAAAKTLRLARGITQKLDNKVMTQVLDRALDELETSKTISLGTAKTMKMGSKTQTLQGNAEAALPPADEIRKLTGA